MGCARCLTGNDLDVIAEQVLAELAKGQASLSERDPLNGLSGMPSVVLEPASAADRCAWLGAGGLHVPLSDAQLADLLEQPGCCGVEFSLDEPREPAALLLSSSSC